MVDFLFSKDNLPKQLIINNEYVNSKSDRKLSVRNPKNGELVADDVPIAGEQDLDAAVTAAEKAFPAWKATLPSKRRDMLNKLADLIDEHGKALGELTRITLGAPWGSFGLFEVSLCAETLRYNAGWTDKFAGESYPQEDGFLKIVRNEPLGVTAGIIPWNGPIGNVGLKAGPALATGNCFILKPSEKTPFAALALLPLIKEAGFPPGVFQILSGDGTTGALLASHMRVRKVSFTGSIPTGKKIQEMAAKSNLKRVTLELGGKSPAVVFNDCNLDNAVTWTVNAITGHSGQVCFAASRVYVQEGIYDKFIEKYKEAFEERTKALGDPDSESTLMGPLVDEAQFKRVTGFIERGKSYEAGTLLTGGARVGDKGYFIEPTIFTNVKPDAEIHTDEIFGPVSVVRTFKTDEEVLKISNDSEYGLMAGVFTQDINKAMRVASAFDSGMVGINCISLMMTQAPFGGSKQSGVGREAGVHALRAFTDPKTIMVNMTY
ncbi:Aldehyde dehydrogenase [Fulvia fulva]|uniref:aldehyde dehydrogenase (NAD(+)) n=1 Tax=Passalora fulva TaxID=5499 RepID=A0A9Q8PCB6_PASFU|nr:Aldehyde dehydrogenase [Fulvia fulva]KAK4620603.1 Aldehyde dehydrogenase [Fulvia fulva]UJO19845.1 Aldehyde dehydrogenase [Fulvia fulva]